MPRPLGYHHQQGYFPDAYAASKVTPRVELNMETVTAVLCSSQRIMSVLSRFVSTIGGE